MLDFEDADEAPDQAALWMVNGSFLKDLEWNAL
jgi:hypothetical protein